MTFDRNDPFFCILYSQIGNIIQQKEWVEKLDVFTLHFGYVLMIHLVLLVFSCCCCCKTCFSSSDGWWDINWWCWRICITVYSSWMAGWSFHGLIARYWTREFREWISMNRRILVQFPFQIRSTHFLMKFPISMLTILTTVTCNIATGTGFNRLACTVPTLLKRYDEKERWECNTYFWPFFLSI